ncbi:uncharacterized protein LOC111260133 [Varroa jacobsoni]|uniref:uncharacterized protein LOC111260133 n=1 Tax=Varroa jacobsoni TaxID=62625 RepID=UPI000BF77144|nr:uncharacterized protein LOC111260133 [Varroa jacobsoni]XP_022688388.1 uncharacterized protein LOC111260133 [Varroa jacobsoni]
MESVDDSNVVPYTQASEAELQLYSLHESYWELTLKHAHALNLIDELRGYHIYGEPIPQSLQNKIGPPEELWPKSQPVELNEKFKQLLCKEATTKQSKLSIRSLGSSLDDLHLASSSHQTSPTIAFPDAPLRGLNSAGRRLTQTRDALRLDDEWLDSGFFSNNKKSKCSTPKSPSTSKSLNSPSRLSESPALKFPESIEVGKPMQKVDAIPVRYGEPPLAQRVDLEVQQKPSTSARFRSRIPRLQKLYLMGTLEDCSSEFLKHPRTNYEDCLIRQENGGNCAPFSSGLPTPTDSGYPPSNCTVIPAIEELHGVDGRDLFWDKLEYDGLRRATSTPALKQSPRHNVKASRRSSASRRKLARALEIASRIAEQLEANTGNLLRTVEEYRRRIQATSGK